MPALIAAIVLLALNLRTVIASLPPLLEVVRADLGLSATVGGLVTTLPVVAFGLLAPLAPRIARRMPPERALAACAVVTAAAAALRGAGGLAPLLAGSLLAGGGVAVSQGLLPLLIRVRHPERTGPLIGAYAMSLNLGAALGAGASAPVEDRLGWQATLAVWALPALLAAVVWALRPVPSAAEVAEATAVVEDVHTGSGEARPPDATRRASRGLAWSIGLFFGIQSAAFYGGLSWLPTILEDAGRSASGAGLLQSLASVVSIPVGLLVPILVARRPSQLPHLAFSVTTAVAGIAGLLLAPSVPVSWVILLGLGQGSALGIALTLPSLRGADPVDVAELTAFSLLVGYCIGALGPWVLGGVHDLTDTWTIPLLALAAITLLELLPGVRAVRPSPATLPPSRGCSSVG